jgi:hypothetical protein
LTHVCSLWYLMSSGFIAASFSEISEVLVYRTNLIFVKKKHILLNY